MAKDLPPPPHSTSLIIISEIKMLLFAVGFSYRPIFDLTPLLNQYVYELTFYSVYCMYEYLIYSMVKSLNKLYKYLISSKVKQSN